MTGAVHSFHKQLEWNQSNEENVGSILNLRIAREHFVIVQFSSLKHQSLLIRGHCVLTAMVGCLNIQH